MEPNFSEPSLPADIRNYAVQQISSIYDTRESLSMVHWLMEAILDLNRNKLLVNDPIMLDKKAWQVFKNALIRLKKNEPIQYILQEAYFFGRRFKVKPGVLVPRPETEELVHWISQNLVKDATIIDIGTGSGCIPVTLKLEKPDWQVHAMDISKIAIDVAKENSEVLHSDITFHQTDILKMPDLGLQFDIIVSNPPYVRNSEKGQMHKNVVQYEPELALFVSDDDPLIFYQTIAKWATRHLKKGGQLYFEINEAFGIEVRLILLDQGFQDVELRRDLQYKDRMIKGVWTKHL
jgi:release factor glutamine methyltransferase